MKNMKPEIEISDLVKAGLHNLEEGFAIQFQSGEIGWFSGIENFENSEDVKAISYLGTGDN